MENNTKKPLTPKAVPSSEPIVTSEDLNNSAKPLRAKPLVEGINSPKSTQDIVFSKPKEISPSVLTKDEQQLITDTPDFKSRPNLLPESTLMDFKRKPNIIGRTLVVAAVALILIIGAYEFYGWYLNRAKLVISSYSGSQQTPDSLSSANAASSTMVGLYGTAATSTPQASTTPMASSGTSSLLSASSSPSSTATTSPAQVLQLTIDQTPTGYLNVRSSPGPSGSIINKVHPGEVYTYTNMQNGWYEISLPSTGSGWVSGQYVTVQN